MNTNVLRNLSYGVYIISTLDGERPTGCVANSVMQITSDTVTVALSLNHGNYTNDCIKSSGRFAVSILSVDSDPGLIGRFGFQSGRTVNKFDGLKLETKAGLPIIQDSCGYMTFRVVNSLETSTHTIFIGEMTDGDIIGTKEAMTYAYYHKAVKGKKPKGPVYKCSVCGYEYDGDIPFEELPEDYVCPICKQPKSVFQKI